MLLLWADLKWEVAFFRSADVGKLRLTAAYLDVNLAQFVRKAPDQPRKNHGGPSFVGPTWSKHKEHDSRCLDTNKHING